MKELFLTDPLHEILERHLIQNSDNEKTSPLFVDNVVKEYVEYLLKQGVHIPGPMKELFISDLREEVRELTIKKTYGMVLPGPAETTEGRQFKSIRKVI